EDEAQVFAQRLMLAELRKKIGGGPPDFRTCRRQRYCLQDCASFFVSTTEKLKSISSLYPGIRVLGIHLDSAMKARQCAIRPVLLIKLDHTQLTPIIGIAGRNLRSSLNSHFGTQCGKSGSAKHLHAEVGVQQR